MSDKEDVKEMKAEGEKPSKLYTPEEVTKIVQRERDDVRKQEEISKATLIVENECLQKEQTKIKADAEKAVTEELDALIKTADPAVVALLPTWGTVKDQLGWLKKATTENPAPPHAKLPVTPRPSGKVSTNPDAEAAREARNEKIRR